jgi:hypothetical protein
MYLLKSYGGPGSDLYVKCLIIRVGSNDMCHLRASPSDGGLRLRLEAREYSAWASSRHYISSDPGLLLFITVRLLKLLRTTDKGLGRCQIMILNWHLLS